MSAELDLHHLAAAYALDALDADERLAFEAHYHDCDVCSHDVRDFRSTLAAVGDLSVATPPADMRARVLDQIAVTRQLSPRVVSRSVVSGPARRYSWLAAAAALLLIVATTAFVVGRGSQTDDAFAAQLEQVLAEPDLGIAELTPTGDAAGQFRVMWSPNSGRAAVIGTGLASLSNGMAYELWLIDDGGAVPMSLLDAAAGGDVRQIVALDGNPLKWGITIEPVAGSPAPTGEILFLGDA